MNIAIIGAGNVGKALAGSSTKAGHSVTISAKTPEHAREAATATGSRAASSNREAAKAADLIVLAVPHGAVDGVLSELGDALKGKVLVDATNQLTPDMSGLSNWEKSAAEQIQARAPGARVVKAFNTVFASRQAQPSVEGTPLDAFVAGDDQAAKTTVLELVESIGFRPIDAGPLMMARSLEAMAFLLISLQVRHGWSWQNGWKIVGPTKVPAGRTA